MNRKKKVPKGKKSRRLGHRWAANYEGIAEDGRKFDVNVSASDKTPRCQSAKKAIGAPSGVITKEVTIE